MTRAPPWIASVKLLDGRPGAALDSDDVDFPAVMGRSLIRIAPPSNASFLSYDAWFALPSSARVLQYGNAEGEGRGRSIPCENAAGLARRLRATGYAL